MKVKLPEEFKIRMKELLKEEYDAYERCFEEKHLGGLRVNTLKLSPETMQEISPYGLRKIPFIPNGFYYQDSEQPAKHPYYFAGLYYLQEPSAMTPASLLPVRPGDKVLDLCAAPGGKSTELAARLCQKGALVANDISNSRAKALLKNIELFGVRNAVVISEAPAKLAENFEGYFDKILVDAPCSGEGMFRKSPAIIKNWEQYGVGYYNKLQKEILPSAIRMLKPGGYLLYSTCTFSPEENEGTIQYVLDLFPEMKVVPALDNPFNQDATYEGFDHGHPEWIQSEEESLKQCVRIWPHKIEGEGHFVTLLKKEEAPLKQQTYFLPDTKESKLISEEAKEFFQHLAISIDIKRITVRDGRLFMLPEEMIDLKGLRVLRSGLLLGEMKKNRFEPSQALASSLKMNEYDNVYNLSAADEDVIRYLKCEAIEIKKPCKNGWLLVCVDGYPLGWGKYNNQTFKNKYLPGWRLM